MKSTRVQQVASHEDLERAGSSTTMMPVVKVHRCCASRIGGARSMVSFVGCMVLLFMLQARENHKEYAAAKASAGSHERRLQTVKIVNMSISTDSCCRGSPSSGWGGLGKNLQPDACVQKCIAEASCEFAAYRPSNGACTSFASCDNPKDAPGFTIFSKRQTSLDFGPALAGVAESCTKSPVKHSLKILGCRGTDSRCTTYSSPNPTNEQPCKTMRKKGASCTWAKEDPTGHCIGHDSRCGEDSYKTKWRCNQLRKSGASCQWKTTQKMSKAVRDSKDMKEKIDVLVDHLQSYIPSLNAKSSSLMSLLGTPVSEEMCRDRVSQIRFNIVKYSGAQENLQIALDPQTPADVLLELGIPSKGALDSKSDPSQGALDSESVPAKGGLDSDHNVVEAGMGPSGSSKGFAEFKKNYAPKIFGCTGHHSQCAGQPDEHSCTHAGGDCSWATTQRSGTCQGNDSRCSLMPVLRWKEECDALHAQGASCSWVLTQKYKQDLAHLTENLQSVVSISVSGFQRLLSKDFEERLAAIESSAVALETTLSSLKVALGMVS